MASKGLKEEYGGLGPDYLYHCIAMEEISRASGSVCINQFGCSPWIFRDFEEIIKELMERLPHMKELMNMFSGPDRVTAKQQMQELDRVAKTLPENIPSSVKRFTDRVVLSL
ncbi:uncharacterized protein LOC109832330 isoform X1 [Asparagus officinalis]|uniref:uncharacterized protein LOC109832330 isoform X1 n=1 Tax=Asparagus officinalis TaxID=4686 RepID=UPI00098E6E70|nr:uncharacterized protein LOC109832330 isoform X1 [Asparagus officinalis]